MTQEEIAVHIESAVKSNPSSCGIYLFTLDDAEKDLENQALISSTKQRLTNHIKLPIGLKARG